MDIIASHQSGLAEKLAAEAIALAGRPRDSGQRAIVYHHVADLTGLRHSYALLAAHGALDLDRAIAAMQRRARRAWWALRRGERDALALRIAVFGEALRGLDVERCAAVLTAYRLATSPGLAGEAARRFGPGLSDALAEAAAGDSAARRRRLFVAYQGFVANLVGERVAEAQAALDWPLAPRAVRAAVAAMLIPQAAHDRAERRGLVRVEARLRRSKLLPAPFATNPAQAFFKLQRHIAERRRNAADADHLSPDDAVCLAA